MADARLLELIEAEAWADIFRAAPRALAEEHGIAVLDLGARCARASSPAMCPRSC